MPALIQAVQKGVQRKVSTSPLLSFPRGQSCHSGLGTLLESVQGQDSVCSWKGLPPPACLPTRLWGSGGEEGPVTPASPWAAPLSLWPLLASRALIQSGIQNLSLGGTRANSGRPSLAGVLLGTTW